MMRLPILVTATAALLAGLLAGLARLGWDLPQGPALAAVHGPLLVCGVFGTLVGLERAVALGRPWAYLGPALSALGTLGLLSGLPEALGARAYAAAALWLSVMSLTVLAMQPAAFTGTLAAGAAAWLAGTLLWAGGAAIPDLAGWWLAFLVLTIAGERLELSRLMPRRRGSLPLFLLAVGLVVAGAALGMTTGPGASTLGLGLTSLAVWLAQHDIARRGLRGRGQVRFMAACMVAGYGWLGTAGLLLLVQPPETAPYGYDVALHAVLLGFVLSMVFGHALIILPAVARVEILYAPALYGPLALLHASVALRLGADLLTWEAGRRWSGWVTAAALLSFALALTSLAGRQGARTGATDEAAP